MSGQVTNQAGSPAEPAPPPAAPAFDDGALLAELEALPAEGAQDGAGAAPQEPARQEPGEAEAPESGDQGDDEAEADEADDQADEADEADEADDQAEADEEPADPETAKRLEAIKRAEKRSREAIARERQALDVERKQYRERVEAELRSTWEPRLEAAQRYEEAAARAQYDPAGVLAALGLSEADFDAAARQLYSLTPEGRKDPKLRDAANRELRDRRSTDELSETRRELQELKQEIAAREQRAQQERQVQEYLGTVSKAAGDETPLVRSMLSKNPQKAQLRLAKVAQDLIAKTGEVPDPADVVRELEAERRAELDELGIDPALATKAKPKPHKQAGETKTAKTISSDLGTPTPPRSEPLTAEDLDADILRALENNSFE